MPPVAGFGDMLSYELLTESHKNSGNLVMHMRPGKHNLLIRWQKHSLYTDTDWISGGSHYVRHKNKLGGQWVKDMPTPVTYDRVKRVAEQFITVPVTLKAGYNYHLVEGQTDGDFKNPRKICITEHKRGEPTTKESRYIYCRGLVQEVLRKAPFKSKYKHPDIVYH